MNDEIRVTGSPLRVHNDARNLDPPSDSRVFIVQDNPSHAFWPAEKHGKLQHCLPSRGDYMVDSMVVRLRQALLPFDPNKDYLLLSGAPLACAVAFAILHERFDKWRVLRWSVPAQDYSVAMVDLMVTVAEPEAA